MHTKGHIDVISLRPSLPTGHHCSYKISRTDEDLTIQEWKKVMNNHRELLGSNIVEGQTRNSNIRLYDQIVETFFSCYDDSPLYSEIP